VQLSDVPVLFLGWALDPVELRRVRVAYSDGHGGREITVGETRGVWKRPDIARLFPDAHDIYNSGWAFPLEPSVLSHVSRPGTLTFYAESGDGRTQIIGTRTIK
jgi:hypothetical protein